MDAVAETARGQVRDGRLDLLEVLPDDEPVVDDEEHVAEPVTGDLPGGAQPPVRRHAVDAALGEVALALLQQGRDLGDRTADAVAVEAGRDAADVREVLQRGERAATEVEAVELHLLRRVHRAPAT